MCFNLDLPYITFYSAQGLHAVNFVPTPQIPALQFLDRVDSGSAAYKAGLKPGDYILEINGHNVASSSHEEAVKFIKESGDTLTLKIMTVSELFQNGNQREMNSEFIPLKLILKYCYKTLFFIKIVFPSFQTSTPGKTSGD